MQKWLVRTLKRKKFFQDIPDGRFDYTSYRRTFNTLIPWYLLFTYFGIMLVFMRILMYDKYMNDTRIVLIKIDCLNEVLKFLLLIQRIHLSRKNRYYVKDIIFFIITNKCVIQKKNYNNWKKSIILHFYWYLKKMKCRFSSHIQ
jgi:hypothetical protein